MNDNSDVTKKFYFLIGFLCCGICSSHKYQHSISIELQRNYKPPACSKNCGPFKLIGGTLHKSEPVKLLPTAPRTSTVPLAQIQQLELSTFLGKSQARIGLPAVFIVDTLRLPPIIDIVKSTYEPKHYIEAPAQGDLVHKQAARLIVIRRRKMKKHKLKKLRKRMKYEWAKVRQRREMRKEKAFQAELIAQIKEAEKFDAEKYVAERLQKAHKVPLPRTWKGKRLPFFIIKEKLGIK
jgi:hypothetical protein